MTAFGALSFEGRIFSPAIPVHAPTAASPKDFIMSFGEDGAWINDGSGSPFGCLIGGAKIAGWIIIITAAAECLRPAPTPPTPWDAARDNSLQDYVRCDGSVDHNGAKVRFKEEAVKITDGKYSPEIVQKAMQEGVCEHYRVPSPGPAREDKERVPLLQKRSWWEKKPHPTH